MNKIHQKKLKKKKVPSGKTFEGGQKQVKTGGGQHLEKKHRTR